MGDRSQLTTPTSTDSNFFIVGIGASAGGLNALEELFKRLPSDSGAAYVVVQHLSPDYKSLMKELLERHTKMNVYRIKAGMELQPNSVYLIPPGQNLTVVGKTLNLTKRKQDRKYGYELNFPIDLFFKSLAQSHAERAIGVILSGSGSDGTAGLKAIKQAGGMTFVQEASTAEFDGMPRSAIATNIIDGVLPIKDLARVIYQCIVKAPEALAMVSQNDELLNDDVLGKIAAILIERENLNFSHYRPRTISRRVNRRFLIKGLKTIEEYIELLKNDVKERDILCADLLINVTCFFRDPEAWSNIENNVLPAIIAQAEPHEELRFWVSACSTGQEAYSLAMLIHEAIAFSDKPLTVKMFATDIDRSALKVASSGIYPLSIAKEISAARLHKYFIAKDNCFQVTRTLREMIIFSFHDLTKDAGFTRMNFVSCRNVLIYMQSSLQSKVIRALHFALIHHGTMFLGEAETPGSFESEFQPIDKKWKLYQKRRDVRLPFSIQNSLRSTVRHSLARHSKSEEYAKESVEKQTLKRILQADTAIALAVNRDNQLVYVGGNAQHIFKTPDGEVTQNLIKMVISPLQLPLNSALHRAKKEKQTIAYRGIKINVDSAIRQIHLQVLPPPTNSHDDLYIIKLEPEAAVSEALPIEEFESNSQAQERINELELELQYTRENLQAIVEELESSNEEQQASNEELIASNEELQSTNEELHSVNEEIHTVNAEYQSKIQELTELGHDIDNLLKSTEIGVIFLDRQLKIRKFTPAASEIIALRHADIERPLAELSWKIDCPNLLELLEGVLTAKESQELEVKLKQVEKYYLMSINLYQADKQDDEGLVLTFVNINETKKAQFALKERERSFQAIFNSMFQFIGVLTPEGITLEANQTALEFSGVTLEDVIDKPFWEAKWWTISQATQSQLKQAIARAAKGEFVRYEVDVLGAQERVATIDFSLKPVFDEMGKVVQLIPEGREISELKQTREQLQKTNVDLEDRVAKRTQTLALFSDRLHQIHRLAIANYESIEDLFSSYLQAGCQMFGLDTGTIAQIENSTYQIIAIESPLDLPEDRRAACKNIDCTEAIESLATVTLDRAGQTESIEDHPLYSNFKFEAFIGTPIFVNGNLYGTLNFADTNPKESGFTEEEREIVELMARDIGNSIASVQAKKALKMSEIRFRNTFDRAAVGVAQVSPEGKFIEVNQRLCDLLGYSRNALVNLTLQEITHAEDFDSDLQLLDRVLQGEISNYLIEKRYIKSDGSIVWANLTVSLVRDDLEQPEYFIAVIEDISDRKQAETALKESKIKLKQVNQAKDNFIAHISHELRTPLTSIIGFSKLLQTDSLIPAQRLHYANIVYQSGEHLLTLINDILDFSKLNASQLQLESEGFNLIFFLSQVVTMLRIRAQEKGIQLLTAFSSKLPTTVSGDSNRLRQVLYNLIDNAIKFTDNGNVTLQVTCITSDNTESEQTIDTQKIRFEVEDTGIGIPQAKLSDIFTAFEQLNSNTTKYTGTGLGLTISQNIVRLMNSQIKVESQENQGSKFWFDLELPLAEEDLPLACLLEPKWQQSRHLQNPQKILIVDDNEDNRILLTGFLQPMGFDVEEAENGAIAIEVAQTFRPDAIVTDLVMPVMDGKKMIAQIKQQSQLKDIPIFMTSANSQTIVQPAEIDCDEFLAKPIKLEKLLDLLENYLELDWHTETTQIVPSASFNLDVPCEGELLHLLELVSFGNLRAVEEKINSLVELENKYTGFAQEIKHLTDSFQQNQLESFLLSFLSNS